MISSTHEATIPIREELPDYPDSYRGKRLLGVDAYHLGHYWCGDRVEVYERRELLDATGGAPAADVQYRKRAAIPVGRIEGGLTEYVANVGAYLDRHVDDADPVYADDATEWEWVSAYARDWVTSRAATPTHPRSPVYAGRSGGHRR